MKTIIQIWKISLTFFLMLISLTVFAQSVNENVFYEDFELGWGSWYADNGVWDVGIPTIGPDSTYSGTKCAGTVLGGNYPANANTRLISPTIILTTPAEGEIIQLKFWQWYITENNYDKCKIQISENSGPWETISSIDFDGINQVWTQYIADLTMYAGSSIRIGFYFTSNGDGAVFNGWYIDDVSIEIGVVNFPNPEDFELGIGNWYADNGLWEVGIPTVGPPQTHSGTSCAGTVLGGNYPANANTRLISPKIKLTAISGQSPMLFFYQWFLTEDNYDLCYLQLSVNDGLWQTIAGPISGSNQVWSQFGVDLSAFVDSTIRIGFYFNSNGDGAVDNGWYVDDIRIDGIITGVEEALAINSSEVRLGQNYPNPFTHLTKIEYSLLKDETVLLSIYNINGELVRTIVNEKKKRGNHSVIWAGRNENNIVVSPGIYFYELKTENKLIRKKMLLLK